MQFYTYDNIRVKDGVVDKVSGQDHSGQSGRIANIGYRDEQWPITVEIYNEETGFYEEHCFSFDELELEV